MNIILCHAQDRDAIWLYLELKKRKVAIELIAPEQLLMADKWEQSIETTSDHLTIQLKNGMTITGTEVHFIINRTQSAQSPVWSKALKVDREYVQAEMNAMLMSGLEQLSKNARMFNPTVGYSLSGVYWSTVEWCSAAQRVGMSVHNGINGTLEQTKTVLIMGDKFLAPELSAESMEKCWWLAEVAQTPLLEITLSQKTEHFISANCFPSFRKYGEPLVELIKNTIYE